MDPALRALEKGDLGGVDRSRHYYVALACERIDLAGLGSRIALALDDVIILAKRLFIDVKARAKARLARVPHLLDLPRRRAPDRHREPHVTLRHEQKSKIAAAIAREVTSGHAKTSTAFVVAVVLNILRKVVRLLGEAIARELARNRYPEPIRNRRRAGISLEAAWNRCDSEHHDPPGGHVTLSGTRLTSQSSAASGRPQGGRESAAAPCSARGSCSG